MAKRTFKFIALTGATPQPVFGSTLTAAVIPSSGQISLPVADSTFCQKGDRILVNPLGPNPEQLGPVVDVPDATHVVVRQMRFAHPSGAFLVLSASCNVVFIQTNGANTGALTFGSSGLMNATTGQHCIAIVPPASTAGSGPAPYIVDDAFGMGNALHTSDYWFQGSAGDSILPSINII